MIEKLEIKTLNQYLQELDLNMATDLKACSKDARAFMLNEETKNLTLIKEFKFIETLYFVGASTTSLSLVSGLKQLKILKLDWLQTFNLTQLSHSNTIEILLI